MVCKVCVCVCDISVCLFHVFVYDVTNACKAFHVSRVGRVICGNARLPVRCTLTRWPTRRANHRNMSPSVCVRRRAWCAICISDLTPTLLRPLLLSMRRFALPTAKQTCPQASEAAPGRETPSPAAPAPPVPAAPLSPRLLSVRRCAVLESVGYEMIPVAWAISL